jgi:NAD(P)H-flavin reductase
MHAGRGRVVEIVLEDGERLVRISCPPNLIPAPGQYLLASDGSDSPLPVPIFYMDSAAEGFIAAPFVNNSWSPGQALHLRGPLGQGFDLPISARRVALVAFDDRPARLLGLIKLALKQAAAVVLVCNLSPDRLPDEVEVQPLSALTEIMSWADYMALDIAREKMDELAERIGQANQALAVREAQVLVRTLMPCGGVADCGVCAVHLKSGWKLACKEGPVLDWRELG